MATDFLVQEALRIARKEYEAETDYFSAKGKELTFCTHYWEWIIKIPVLPQSAVGSLS